MQKQGSLIAIMVVLVLLAGGGGFYGGMQYQKSQMPSFAQGGQNGQRGQGGQGGTGRFFGGQGGRPVSGEVISQDSSSITVKMQDGSTKIVMLSGTTSISKFAKGTKTDIKKGERVMAFGKENSDGSITANMVQIGGPRPQGAGAQGGNSQGNNAQRSN
ncbi:MAG TPA: hypothetical protein VGK02_06945 [Candidatus Aquicultor sp.]|jgi:hypothetical protein